VQTPLARTVATRPSTWHHQLPKRLDLPDGRLDGKTALITGTTSGMARPAPGSHGARLAPVRHRAHQLPRGPAGVQAEPRTACNAVPRAKIPLYGVLMPPIMAAAMPLAKAGR
jgi:hypothetical protein